MSLLQFVIALLPPPPHHHHSALHRRHPRVLSPNPAPWARDRLLWREAYEPVTTADQRVRVEAFIFQISGSACAMRELDVEFGGGGLSCRLGRRVGGVEQRPWCWCRDETSIMFESKSTWSDHTMMLAVWLLLHCHFLYLSASMGLVENLGIPTYNMSSDPPSPRSVSRLFKRPKVIRCIFNFRQELILCSVQVYPTSKDSVVISSFTQDAWEVPVTAICHNMACINCLRPRYAQ